MSEEKKSLETADEVKDENIEIEVNLDNDGEKAVETTKETPEKTVKTEEKAEKPVSEEKTDKKEKLSQYVETDDLEIPAEDDLEGRKNFGQRAKKRISQLVKQRKEADERAESEAADKAKVLAYAVQLQQQHDLAVLNAWQQAEIGLKSQLALAQRKVNDAGLASDPAAQGEALGELTQIQVRLEHASKNRSAVEAKVKATPRQPVQQVKQTAEPVQREETKPQVSEGALEWKDQNPWFGKDEVMTSAAMGIHRKLMSEGVVPDTEEYYGELNSRIRGIFPAKFRSSAALKDTKQVVAGATRTPATKGKITLTPSEQAKARKLGVTFEDYAREKALIAAQGGN